MGPWTQICKSISDHYPYLIVHSLYLSSSDMEVKMFMSRDFLACYFVSITTINYKSAELKCLNKWPLTCLSLKIRK